MRNIWPFKLEEDEVSYECMCENVIYIGKIYGNISPQRVVCPKCQHVYIISMWFDVSDSPHDDGVDLPIYGQVSVKYGD